MDLVNKILADNQYSLTGPGIAPDSNSSSQLEDIISMVLGALTIFAVIYFALQIIFSGYAFLSSQGDTEKLATARKRLTNGILGLTIVVIAFGASAFLARLLGLGDIFNLSEIIDSISPQ